MRVQDCGRRSFPPATFLPGRAAAPPKDDTDSALCAHYNSSSSVYHRVPGHPLEGNQRLLALALEAPAGTFSSDAEQVIADILPQTAAMCCPCTAQRGHYTCLILLVYINGHCGSNVGG